MLLDPVDMSYHFFGASLSSRDLAGLLAKGGETIILELEVLPVLVCRRVWADRLRGRSHISFVDNAAAKDGLVAGYSRNAVACELIARVTASDIVLGARPWYERVPSSSNVADAPSRGPDPQSFVGWSAPVRAACSGFLRDALGAVLGG